MTPTRMGEVLCRRATVSEVIHDMHRTNSAAGASDAAGGFRKVVEDGVEYLVADVVAQREGVYYYPAVDGGVRRELAPAEELEAAIEGVNRVPIVVSHPEGPNGDPTMLHDTRSVGSVVGEWRDLRTTEDGQGIAGATWIRAAEVGEHDGALRSYVNAVRRRGLGEVSTGYDIEHAEPASGYYNGQQYEYIQRGIQLDHLALLPEEQGDCSVADGCGVGRANQSDGTDIRTNHHRPGSGGGDESDDAGTTPTPGGVTAEDLDQLHMRLNEDIPYEVTSLDPEDVDSYTAEEWNGSQVFADAPNPSEDDDAPAYLDQICLVNPTEGRDDKSNWKLPVRASPDSPVNTRGVSAVIAAINGARGGVEGVSTDVLRDAYDRAVDFLVDAPDDVYASIEERDDAPGFEGRANFLTQLGRRAAALLGIGDDASLPTTPAEPGAGTPRSNAGRTGSDQRSDQQKIDDLVDGYGFTRENIAPLGGTTCLQRIHEAVVDEEGTSTDNMGDNGSDNGNGSGSGDGDGPFSEEQEEQIRDVVSDVVSDEVTESIDVQEAVGDSLEDTIESKLDEKIEDLDVESGSVSMDDLDTDELVDELTGQVEQARANERQIELVANSDEVPLERDQLERMNEDVVADLAEDVEEADDGGDQDRANFAGRPTGGSFDASEFDGDEGPDVPVAGGGLTGGSDEGDD